MVQVHPSWRLTQAVELVRPLVPCSPKQLELAKRRVWEAGRDQRPNVDELFWALAIEVISIRLWGPR